MLVPSGAAEMTSIDAPVAARIRGPTTDPDPLAASSRIRRPRASIDDASADAVGEVVVEPRRGIHHPTEIVVPRAAQLLGPPDELFQLVLDRVVELEPVRRRAP